MCHSGYGFGSADALGMELRGEGGEGDGVDNKMSKFSISVSSIWGPL